MGSYYRGFVYLACAISCICLVRGRPAELPPVEIINHESSGPDGAEFSYKFEAANGIKEEVEGKEGPEGASIMSGSYLYFMDDGSTVLVEWTADENGYVAKSSAIPTA